MQTNWEETSWNEALALAVLNTHIKARKAVARPLRAARKKLLLHLLSNACVRVSTNEHGEMRLEVLDNAWHIYGGKYELARSPIAGPKGFYRIGLVSAELEDEVPNRTRPSEQKCKPGKSGDQTQKTQQNTLNHKALRKKQHTSLENRFDPQGTYTLPGQTSTGQTTLRYR